MMNIRGMKGDATFITKIRKGTERRTTAMDRFGIFLFGSWKERSVW